MPSEKPFQIETTGTAIEPSMRTFLETLIGLRMVRGATAEPGRLVIAFEAEGWLMEAVFEGFRVRPVAEELDRMTVQPTFRRR